MNATRIFLHFALASMVAYITLHYFGFAYESLLLFAANRIAQILSIDAHLMHDASHQPLIVVFLPSGSVPIKLAGFDWIYASQCAATGVVVSTYAPRMRKAYSLVLICTLLAFAHTALLVMAIAEISKQISGTDSDLAYFGAITFRLYRIVLPALLASAWVICSREMLFTVNVFNYGLPLPIQQQWKGPFQLRSQSVPSMPD